MTIHILCLCVVAALLTGCACGPATPRSWADHPANPRAAAAELPPASPTLTTATPAATAQPEPAGVIVYTCPMHPHVAASEPGQCPKCGMTLVPRGPDEETP